MEAREVDYYTQPVLDTRLKLLETRETKRYGEAEIGLGHADVNWSTVAMKKIRFRSLDTHRLSPARTAAAQSRYRSVLDPPGRRGAERRESEKGAESGRGIVGTSESS